MNVLINGIVAIVARMSEVECIGAYQVPGSKTAFVTTGLVLDALLELRAGTTEICPSDLGAGILRYAKRKRGILLARIATSGLVKRGRRTKLNIFCQGYLESKDET